LRLKNLTDEQLYEEHPEAQRYAYNSFLLYEKTTQGAEDFEKALSAYREEAKTASFAAGESRVAALVEIAEELLVRFRRELSSGSIQEITATSREFREIMRELRAETDPMGGTAEELSFFERMMTTVATFKPREQRLLVDSEPIVDGSPRPH
jgi:hypothetical protein